MTAPARAWTRLAAAFAATCVVGAGAAAGLAPAAWAMGAAGSGSRPSLPVIERQVMCVTCKIPLNVAESPQADRERAYIQSLIDEGRTEAQIKRALVAQYGPTVLGLPSAHGFDITVYAVPAAVVAALALLAAVLLPRWRRRARDQAGQEPPPELSASDAARLDSDLARFD
jgi:cytochrome c-type biogenesis protein CcmH